MPGELGDLMNELPESLGGTTVTDDDDQDDEELEEDDDEQEDVQDEADDEEDSEDEDAEEEDADDEEDEDDFVIQAGDEDTVDKPDGAPQLDDEGAYILKNLSKIPVDVIVTGANGKDEIKRVEVYGMGDLLKTPGIKSFANDLGAAAFQQAANNNEARARELQTDFRRQKADQDLQTYTVKENKAIADDLTDLRRDGLFPKFKGMPGSREFNDSEGAKTFDEVVRFMNEQNDEAGQAANKGRAFYHMSFKTAYRILHPEAFNTKAKAAQKRNERTIARRVKSGGGTRSTGKNIQTKRVTNMTDLIDEFGAFTGSSK